MSSFLCQSDACDQKIDQLDANERRDNATDTVDEQVTPQQCRRAHRTIADTLQRQRDQGDDDEGVEDHR